MKSFIAIVLGSVPEMIARPLLSPIHLALSYDEEVGCLGVRPLIEHIVANERLPKIAIVGEPTGLNLVNAHKSGYRYLTKVTGVGGHSSSPDDGVNAIEWAARLINELYSIESRLARDEDPSNRFCPPRSTVHVGTISGGTALNVIPHECVFEWEYRGVPLGQGEAIREEFERYICDCALPEMRSQGGSVQIVTTPQGGSPALAAEANSPAMKLLKGIVADSHPSSVSYGTEAGLFQHAGISTVVCGPGHIAQAHQPNEYISCEQFEEGTRFVRRIIERLRSTPL